MPLTPLGDAVDFFMWTDPRERLGRHVRLDGMNRIIAIPFGVVPAISYKNAEVLITRTGAPYIHSRFPALRGDMPAWCLLVRRWHRARVFHGPLGDGLTGECVACKIFSERTGEAGFRDPCAHGMDRVFNCASCALVWHEACSAHFTRVFCRLVPFFDDDNVCVFCNDLGRLAP